VVTLARTQSVLVYLVLEFTGAEADTEHTVFDLITLPGASLPHNDVTLFTLNNHRDTSFYKTLNSPH